MSFFRRWLIRVVLVMCGGLSSISVAQIPANNNFANAIPLYGSSVSFTGSLVNATYEAGESYMLNGRYYSTGGSVWWTWTATNTTAVVISSIAPASGVDAGFAVHSATNLSDIVNFSELDWNYADFITNRYACFQATAGKTYRIRALGATPVPIVLRLVASNVVFLVSPTNQSVVAGSSAFFTTIAAGLPPLKYQWQRAGVNLPGQTAPSLILHSLSPAQAGGYSVVISNVSGFTTSSIANLEVTSSVVQNQLAIVNPSLSNRFYFTLTADAGRRYRILSSTNLVNWNGEESIGPYPILYGVVLNTNGSSTFSVPRTNRQKFFRTTSYFDGDMCAAHLKAIYAAQKLWAIEHRYPYNANLAESDIVPYLKDGSLACPSLGTGANFAQCYLINTVSTTPVCKIAPTIHQLP